jgi:hypothetical protein
MLRTSNRADLQQAGTIINVKHEQHVLRQKPAIAWAGFQTFFLMGGRPLASQINRFV